MTGRQRPPLQLSVAEFRELADRAVAAAAEYLETLEDRPIMPATSGAETAELFAGPAPEEGLGAAAFSDLSRVAEHARAGNGRLFAYVVGSGEPVGALADLYASVLNQNVTAWRSTPAAAAVERTVIGWLASAAGCEGFSGSLTSGGSMANLMGLAMAREAKAPANEQGAQPGVVYASEEVHMSIPRAVALLGLGRENLRVIEVDDAFRMRPDALRAAIEDDARTGRRALAVVASAGTTNTGAVDPLREVASITAESGLWLHVDGAYGALAALAEPERFDGLALADSLSLDAHKWLYQPIDCSAILFRDADNARRAFSFTGDYARSSSTDRIEGFAFFDESLELSRRFRALKLWLSIRYYGLAAFAAAIKRDLQHARQLAQLIEAQPALELVAPVDLSTVCFRWIDGPPETLDARNVEILRRINARGNVLLSNATVRGAFALRACFVNHRTTQEDVAAIVEEVTIVAAAS